MSRIFAFIIALLFLPALAHADAGTAGSIWASWLPEAVSPVKVQYSHFNTIMNWVISGIVAFVAILLCVTLLRFRRKANPVPSSTTHNIKLEIIWTLIPCLILLAIVVPSLRLMYFEDKTSKPDLTLKVTGYQWYWGYSYPDQNIDEFSLNIIPNEELDTKHEFTALRAQPTYQRLLSTYDLSSGKAAFVVLPVEKNIRVLVTGSDVIHSFAMPAFGVKKDAVPGRLNETWFRVDKPGIYYGQCSQVCGINHGYMPIEIRAVSDEQFQHWATLMKTNSVQAMAYIQDATVQYAHPQLAPPQLTPMSVWQDLKNYFQVEGK